MAFALVGVLTVSIISILKTGFKGQRTIASRERLSEKLAELGFDVLPSAANFVFARHPAHHASSLFTALRERGIIVRYFDKPRISEFLRISVGTDAQCDALLQVLEELLA